MLISFLVAAFVLLHCYRNGQTGSRSFSSVFSFFVIATKKETKKGLERNDIHRVPFIVLRFSGGTTVTSKFVFHLSINSQRQTPHNCRGSTALHHSTTKAELKYHIGNAPYSFPIVFFCFFFGQAKKKIRTWVSSMYNFHIAIL